MAKTKSGVTPGNRTYTAFKGDLGDRITRVSQPGKTHVKRTFSNGKKDKYVIEGRGSKSPMTTRGKGPKFKLNKLRTSEN